MQTAADVRPTVETDAAQASELAVWLGSGNGSQRASGLGSQPRSLTVQCGLVSAVKTAPGVAAGRGLGSGRG